MKTKIEIGTLVLEGFDYHDHLRISGALEQEFVRIISKNGVSEKRTNPQAKSAMSLPLTFTAPSDLSPRKIGSEIARCIYTGLKL
jgi:hypothetical protein